MVKSAASVPLNKKQLFANSYGSNSEGLKYVSKHGDIKPIFKAPLLGGLAAGLISVCSLAGTSSLKGTMKSILQYLGILLIVFAIGCILTYLFTYIIKYLPEYRGWYAKLPEEALTELAEINKNAFF